MKKLMTLAAVAMTAAITQAAAIQWSVANNSWTLNDGSRPAQGTTVYLILADYTQSIAAAITSTGTLDTGTEGLCLQQKVCRRSAHTGAGYE